MRMKWEGLRHRGKATEPARNAKADQKGAQTHIKRELVKQYTDAEISRRAKTSGSA